MSDAEGIAVDASRLLATLCCPQDPKEAAQTHYGPMKSQLLLKISVIFNFSDSHASISCHFCYSVFHFSLQLFVDIILMELLLN